MQLLKSPIKSIVGVIKRITLSNKSVFIESGVDFAGTLFEGNNRIGRNCVINHSNIGFGTYICENSTFYNVKIGKYCSLGSNIKMAIGKHPTHTFVSTHPAFFSTNKQAGFTYASESSFSELKFVNQHLCEIGNDVWIGTNVTIMDGIKIGDGAIIGAGSLVTKDIEPYSINVGNPSRIVKYRFTEEEIDFLLKLKWWDQSQQWIKDHRSLFTNIAEFRKHLTNRS